VACASKPAISEPTISTFAVATITTR
jgi:hypothetical protein